MHIVWHRAELRLHDHPALHFARQMAEASGQALVPLVIIDPIIFGRDSTTPRRRAWFLAHVRALREACRRAGSDLIVREGEPHHVFAQWVVRHETAAVHFVCNYTPYAKERDAKVRAVLERAGVAVYARPGHYTHEPGEVTTQSRGRFQVFSPYSSQWSRLPMPPVFGAPKALPPVPPDVARGGIPTATSDIALPAAGEAAALRCLDAFLARNEGDYAEARDRPDHDGGTSRLNWYFTVGALSPRLAAHRCQSAKWRSELVWRDFFADVLERCPESAATEYRPAWRGFPWRTSEEETERWKLGRTGFPIVDAGMRELLHTGFMHNRVRMITASFLTKHLLIDWRIGEELFRGLLLDGESAQNIGNWQWVAGCGVDAAPYFRVFNPVLQGKKFDPEGGYVRRYVPELESVPARYIHEPWKLPAAQRPAAYPAPMIDLQFGRDRFLETAKKFLSAAGSQLRD